MKQQMSKSLQKRVIFLLAATVTFLIIPQSTGLPLRDEMTGVWKLFSQKGLAILFSYRQWLAMELLLFAAVMVTIQMVWEQKEIVYKNKAVKGILPAVIVNFFCATALYNSVNCILVQKARNSFRNRLDISVR